MHPPMRVAKSSVCPVHYHTPSATSWSWMGTQNLGGRLVRLTCAGTWPVAARLPAIMAGTGSRLGAAGAAGRCGTFAATYVAGQQYLLDILGFPC